jgi:ATP/maltotriose-dependent transcriptional regulator MalT
VAARHATEVFAYGEAARQLDRALLVQDLVVPDDLGKRCDLLLTLGEALFQAGDNERVISHIAPDAFALAEGLGDRSRAFRASRLAVDCLFAHGSSLTVAQAEYLTWAERTMEYAAPESIERIHADLAVATARFNRGHFAQARQLRLEALALARHHADAEGLFNTAYFHLGQIDSPQHWDERVRLAEECAGWPRQAVSSQILGMALWYSGYVRLAQGERAGAEELWVQMRELAQRTHLAGVLYTVADDAILGILDGHLEDVLARLMRLVERVVNETGGVVSGLNGVGLNGVSGPMMMPALYLGRADAWLAAFDENALLTGSTQPGRPTAFFIRFTDARALCLAQLGRVEEARALVRPLLDAITGGTIDAEVPFGSLALLLQAAVALKDQTAAQALAARLACVADLSGDTAVTTCVGRHLGDAAALVGDRTAARAYYAQALESASKIRFRPELALTHLRLAELLLKDADEAGRSDALEHLDLTIPELQDMKMQPSLERALALRETLVPAPAQAPAHDSGPDVLTAREREIAGLVADGLSNHDIAERLVITEGTVEVHVKHILGKLGYRSRTQVAGWVARQSPG